MIVVQAAGHGERVGPAHQTKRRSHRVEQPRVLLTRAVDQVRHDLGVGVARKAHSFALELTFQLEVILDDAVVHHRDVTGDVRMSIGLTRPTVGRPARVPEPGRAREVPRLDRGSQVLELAHRAHDLDRLSVVDREPGRVVAAVLELGKPIEQNGSRLPRPDVTDDSTHG